VNNSRKFQYAYLKIRKSE